MVRELDAGWGFAIFVVAVALTIVICTVSYNLAPHVEHVCFKGHDQIITTGAGTSMSTDLKYVCDNWQDVIVGEKK